MSMNFITWDRVYSLYPRATLEERRALVTFDKGVRFEEAMLKYTSRGYRIETMLFKEDTTAGAFALGPRWVGDERCWVVKLDTTGITPPVYPLDPEVNSWRLAYCKPNIYYRRLTPRYTQNTLPPG
ncbi:hypothetical protein EXIGLDRAFT_835998 [Exidia glandulosa HHB12029]|uniref:Uncharacterized protein n=1 Tax=Exidia glandulosa HHB12029 TaxID=1314781 RepID=A0A165I9S9_EXIGL|nr:hypothetical protein EXIGLDRAFT_835998 [Exidia glandulosa HHB12029]